MTKVVTVEHDQHVAIVTLSRPEKMNALNLETFQALIDTGRMLADDKSVRAIVLHGAGKHFCSGIDITVFQGAGLGDAADSRMAPMEDSPANFFQRAALIWREMPVPVIAALQGIVYGGGLQVALGADIRIAAPNTRCSVMEVRWGIIPDMGISNSLRATVRLDHLRELTYTGRVVDAAEAESLGLVSRISDDPLAAARELALKIAANSPDAVRAAKQLLNSAFELPPELALRMEARLQSQLIGGSNQVEAVRSNMEKREPRFQAPVEIDMGPG